MEQAHHYASPDQLRIGLYIHVDMAWYLHPFTLNSFKISSEEQIRALQTLKVPRFRYDPALSDGDIDIISSAAPAEPAAEAPDTAPHSAALQDPLRTQEDARVRQLRERRSAVARTEKAFMKAAAVMHRLNRNLRSHSKETLEEMGGLVDLMVTVFLEQPEVALHVMGEKCGGEEAYHHGLNVSVLCMMLAKGLDFTPEQARMLGAGALLHDIGLIDVPAGVQRKDPEEYTKPERDLRAMHVIYGMQSGRHLGVSPEVLSIIAQHHELADGSGYPHGLKLEQIAPLARVVSLANFYDNLCNPVVLSRAMTPHEALSFIFARRRNQFDVKVLQLMIHSLGVYPPGSIVKLSNEATAMVVSVNPQRPLRPWVLLHDAAVPKEEAIMLNLETETDLSIGKAIRPGLLPPAVYAYLSPRKRITYFFDSESPETGARA